MFKLNGFQDPRKTIDRKYVQHHYGLIYLNSNENPQVPSAKTHGPFCKHDAKVFAFKLQKVIW